MNTSLGSYLARNAKQNSTEGQVSTFPSVCETKKAIEESPLVKALKEYVEEKFPEYSREAQSAER